MTASISNFTQAVTTAGDGVAIIAATSAIKGTVVPLLNASLSLSLPLSDSPTSSRRPATSLTALSASSGPLVLALDGVDTTEPSTIPTNSSTSSLDHSFALAASLAGVLLLSVRMLDLPRPRAAAIPQLMAAVERSLALRVAAISPPLPARRLLVIAVRDFDADIASEQDVRTAVEDVLTSEYEALDRPHAFAGTSLSDVFDVHVALLPSHSLFPAEFATAAQQLGAVLRDANKTYADAGMTVEALVPLVDRLAAAICSDGPSDLPSERELQASFACYGHMQTVLERFRNAAKVWKASVDAGRVVRNFGAENDRLIDRTLDVYDKDAVAYKSTHAFSRKREELMASLLADSYALFAKQILKVREDAYQVFRAKLARIRINGQVEKNVKGAVKEAEGFFIRNAESLRCKHGNWRFDNERHELVNHMRDDATERLQLARLQGNYVPNIRAPIAFAFHTLLAAPFGRDSRAAQPQEEMRQTYDPDKMKQPGLMRSRPRQRGAIFSVSGKDECGEEVVDMFAGLYDGDETKE